MSIEQDHHFLRLAITASRQALAAGNRPFGAALVSPDGALLHVASNNQLSSADCTGHAELNLVREASARLGPQSLLGSTVYASGEPCAMCAGALFWAGVGRVVYGASNASIGRHLGGPSLGLHTRETLAQASPAVQVDGPMLEAEAAAVLAEAAPPRAS